MACCPTNTDVVSVIATEMASGVERAVDLWMAQFDEVMADHRLTTLGRLNAVQDILESYKAATGKATLHRRNKVCFFPKR